MPDEKMRVAAYARYSSDNQRDESIAAQFRAIRYYADQKGDEIVAEYEDKALSGRTVHRPGLQAMMEAARQGNFDAIIVHKLDRFSRNAADSLHYEEELRDHGVQLISVTEQLENTPEGSLMKCVLIGMNQFYSQNLGREVMKGLKENALKCQHNGGIPALGYDVAPDKTYIINEQEAVIVRKIFDLYANCGWGYKRIINELNACGYTTKAGKPFGKNSLHDLLKNPKYKGTYVFNKAVQRTTRGKRNYHRLKNTKDIICIENGVPAIVSAEVFDKAQTRMQSNKRQAAAYKAKEVYLLSGLIYCGECGCKMSGNARIPGRGRAKYMSYRCNKRDRTKACPNREVRREYVENYVICQLERYLLNDAILPTLVKKLNAYQKKNQANATGEQAQLESELTQTTAQLENIVAAVANGMFQEIFKTKADELQRHQQALEARLKAISAQSQPTCFTEEQVRG